VRRGGRKESGIISQMKFGEESIRNFQSFFSGYQIFKKESLPEAFVVRRWIHQSQNNLLLFPGIRTAYQELTLPQCTCQLQWFISQLGAQQKDSLRKRIREREIEWEIIFKLDEGKRFNKTGYRVARYLGPCS
jgi:hypothetical protein